MMKLLQLQRRLILLQGCKLFVRIVGSCNRSRFQQLQKGPQLFGKVFQSLLVHHNPKKQVQIGLKLLQKLYYQNFLTI